MAKPKTPSEKHIVLLGLVAEEPSHAYGLEEKVRSRYMTKWTEIGLSSIYRVLSQLEEHKLIDSHLEHEGQGATRKVYRINAAGREVLTLAVLNLLGDVRPLKNPFQLGLAFLPFAPREQALEQLHQRTNDLSEWEEQLLLIKEKACENPRSSKHLVLEHACRHLRAEREFLNDVMTWVEQEVS